MQILKLQKLMLHLLLTSLCLLASQASLAINPRYAATEQDKQQLAKDKFCRKVRNFALEVAYGMKRGVKADTIIDDFGGLNTADPVAVGVVYFVYSYRNMHMSAGRIATAAETKCKNNGF
jgi:hypothetical protein